jgi:hypothetical protein
MTSPEIPHVALRATTADGVQAQLTAFNAGNSHALKYTWSNDYSTLIRYALERDGIGSKFLGVNPMRGAQIHHLGGHGLGTCAGARLWPRHALGRTSIGSSTPDIAW